MKLKIVITCIVTLALVFLWISLTNTDEHMEKEVIESTSRGTSVGLNLKMNKQPFPEGSDASEVLNKDKDDAQIEPIRITQVFEPKRNLTKKELSLMKLNEIKEALKVGSRIVQPSPEQGPVKSAEEAFSLMNFNISMAYLPDVYFEDDDFFYFSGGTRAYRVVDFSTGIAVKKADRSITSW